MPSTEFGGNEGTTKRTLYVGNLEIVSQGGITTYKRYVAGVMVQDVTGSTVTNQFLFHDHIGSVIRAVSASGAVIEGMDYGAFGERRGYTDPTLPAAVPQTTTRGFTGHEMIDGTDVVPVYSLSVNVMLWTAASNLLLLPGYDWHTIHCRVHRLPCRPQ